jgi:hypothetical protein
MSRQEIVDSTHTALLELNRVKGENRLISKDYMDEMDRFLRDCADLLKRLDGAGGIEDPDRRDEALTRIKEESDSLHRRSSLVKEEIRWPVEGARFHYAGILRMILGSLMHKRPSGQ